MSVAADTVPVVIISASELGSRSGNVLHEVRAGSVIRVDDFRLGRTVGWISAEPPASVADLADRLPLPGEVADHPGPP